MIYVEIYILLYFTGDFYYMVEDTSESCLVVLQSSSKDNQAVGDPCKTTKNVKRLHGRGCLVSSLDGNQPSGIYMGEDWIVCVKFT